MKRLFSITAALLAMLAAANAEDAPERYPPMAVFAPLDGKTLRGEGNGPDGKPIVDYAKWEMILGGRAFQSTHKLKDHSYGGRTIFFFDEGAKKYIFHYFTTAGFHTTGELTPIDNGFVVVEKVEGHDTFAEVHSTMTIGDGVFTVASSHVTHDGDTSEGETMVYRETDEEVVLFFDEADAIIGKRTDVDDKHDRHAN